MANNSVANTTNVVEVVSLSVDQLSTKLRVIRSQITRCCNRLTDLFDSEVDDVDVNTKILAISDVLSKHSTEHHRVFALYELYLDDASQEFEMDQMETYDLKVGLILQKLNFRNAKAQTTPCFQVSDVAKLPKLEIEKFDGNFQNWQSFWNEFEHTIHNDVRLSVVTKLKYLKSLLTGEPFLLIKDAELNSVGYQLALEQLKHDYGRPEQLRNNHIKAIHLLSPVDDMFNVAAVKQLESTLRIHCTALDKVGVDIDVFMTFIIDKLPRQLYQMFREKHEDSKSVMVLLDYVKSRIRTIQEWNLSRQNSTPTNSMIRRDFLNSTIPTTAVLNVNVPQSSKGSSGSSSIGKSSKDYFCFICNIQGHGARVCNADLSIKEKKDILISKGRCLKCFRLGHQEEKCNFVLNNCRRCDLPHFQTFCPKLEKINAKIQQEIVNTSSNNVNLDKSPSETFDRQGDSLSLLNTAVVNITHGGRSVKTLCLLDNGSQRTFLSRSISNSLNLQAVKKETFVTGVFGGSEAIQTYELSQCLIEGVYVPSSTPISVLIVDKPSSHRLPSNNQRLVEVADKIKSQGRITAVDYRADTSLSIGIIVGMDFYHSIVSGSAVLLEDDLYIQQSIFGWTITGTIYKPWADPRHVHHINCHSVALYDCCEALNDRLENFWKIEDLGHKETLTDSPDQFDIDFRLTTFFNEATGRYSVRLPWREELKSKLNSNFGVALNRLRANVLKLEKDTVKFDDYDLNLIAYLKNGQAEEIFYTNLNDEILKGYYLPHLGVYSETKSTKTRIVFDASASLPNDVSLNDCVNPGSDRSLDVVDMLHNFRTSRWALVGDIRKAFLQIELDVQDRDYVRFLWIDKSLPREKWFTHPRIIRMSRVLFGINASPALLRSTIRLHAEKYCESMPEVFDVLRNKLYVDDIITGADSTEGLISLKTNVVNVLQDANLPVHKIRTNHALDAEWNKDEVDTATLQYTTVLGVGWDTVNDEVILKIPDKLIFQEEKLTKRSVISMASTVFDPLGWLAPLVIRVRILFQLMWILGLKWDDDVPDEVREAWFQWIAELKQRTCWRFPRYLYYWKPITDTIINYLHVFADAGPRAYGAVAYLVSKSSSGICHSSIIQSRFRVAPLKFLSIPRLELLAALMAATLAAYLHKTEHFQFTDTFLWSDSKITLYWITKFKPRNTTFVNNRISKIRNLTDLSWWGYCPSEENPADLATKNNIKEPFGHDNISWLRQSSDKWKSFQSLGENDVVDDDDDDGYTFSGHTVCHTSHIQDNVFDICCEDFDSFQNLLQSTVTLMKLAGVKSSTLNLKIEAEKRWIRFAQQEFYSQEIEDIVHTGHVTRFSSLHKLRPVLDDDGLLRLCTRLNSGDLDDNWTRPYILPKNHHISNLIIRQFHRDLLHAGVSTTLLNLRHKFWIISARTAVKKEIRNCLICARWSNVRFQQPQPPLPAFRTATVLPFSNVGMDFAGPVYLYDYDRSVKGYILLFTCATTRAVHLELTLSLKASDCILALKRFTSRRGIPRIIYSDNATTFKSTNDIMDRDYVITDLYQIEDFMVSKNIQWNNIVEKAPWWGGYWERLVKSIKEPIRKTLGKTSMDIQQFNTLLCEVESVINSRPLTILYDSPDDWIPVTPSELIIGRTIDQINTQQDESQISIEEVVKQRSRFFQHFINMWQKAYLGQLRSLHQFDDNKDIPIHINDVVLLEESPFKRQLWPLAKVTEVHVGIDGRVRSCTVTTDDGRVLNRPIQLMVKLPSMFSEEYAKLGGAGSVKECIKKDDVVESE